MSLFTYDLIQKYDKNNLVKDFLFQDDQHGWFLTKTQLTDYLKRYIPKIPASILDAMETAGWQIVFTNKSLEDKFLVTFEVYGMTDYNEKTAYVYAHELGIQYSLAHEIGHFLDNFLNNISNTTEWNAVKQEHKDFRIPAYYFSDKDNAEEYFANCFLLYINDKELLRKCNNRACLLFDKIVNNMDAIMEIIIESDEYEKETEWERS